MNKILHNLCPTGILFALLICTQSLLAIVPSIQYTVVGNKLILTFTGTLCVSRDLVTWQAYESVKSPVTNKLTSIPFFFCAKATPDPTIGTNWIVSLSKDVQIRMNYASAGMFTMGAPAKELGRGNDEAQHTVVLSNPFWISETEITQAQYSTLTGTNPSGFKASTYPVENVTWTDAMNFCAILTALERKNYNISTNYQYTLPTEAQWEYACRAGTKTALNNGKDLTSVYNACPNLNEVGWYSFNSNDQTHAVKGKKVNNWGLYDMHGNVYEWCLDWYGAYDDINISTDPTGPESGDRRVVRGGSWHHSSKYCRSASRNYYYPSYKDKFIGFRIVLVPVN